MSDQRNHDERDGVAMSTLQADGGPDAFEVWGPTTIPDGFTLTEAGDRVPPACRDTLRVGRASRPTTVANHPRFGGEVNIVGWGAAALRDARDDEDDDFLEDDDDDDDEDFFPDDDDDDFDDEDDEEDDFDDEDDDFDEP